MFAQHQRILVKPIPFSEAIQAGFVETLVVGRVEINDVEGLLAPALAQPSDQFPPFGADLRSR